MNNYCYVCNYKNCINKSIFSKYCIKHYNIFYNKYAVIIQKNYLRYKNNKKLKNIYCKLPDDLQNRVKFFINQGHFYKQYKYKINKIINTKIIKYFFYKKFDINFTIHEITYHYYLLHKYYTVLNINILKYFYTLTFEINRLLTYIFEQDVISLLNFTNQNYNLFVNHITIENLDTDIILNCIQNINKFKFLYENNIVNTIVYY
jgi:hypothetical protein